MPIPAEATDDSMHRVTDNTTAPESANLHVTTLDSDGESDRSENFLVQSAVKTGFDSHTGDSTVVDHDTEPDEDSIVQGSSEVQASDIQNLVMDIAQPPTELQVPSSDSMPSVETKRTPIDSTVLDDHNTSSSSSNQPSVEETGCRGTLLTPRDQSDRCIQTEVRPTSQVSEFATAFAEKEDAAHSQTGQLRRSSRNRRSPAWMTTGDWQLN